MVSAVYFFFIMDYQAKWLAKNPNNIQTGCLYFLNESKGMIVQVGDWSSEVNSFKIDGSPFEQKSTELWQHLRQHQDKTLCYPVQYVNINLLFLNRSFVYDVEIPK